MNALIGIWQASWPQGGQKHLRASQHGPGGENKGIQVVWFIDKHSETTLADYRSKALETIKIRLLSSCHRLEKVNK